MKDRTVLRLLLPELRSDGYRVAVSTTGRAALRKCAQEPPDAVLLAAGLPDLDGLSVLRLLREHTQAPVIMLGRPGFDKEKVWALDLGADDYIAKPFFVEEVLARVGAVLRRCRAPEMRVSQDTVDLGDGIFLDLNACRLMVRGIEVALRRSEWQLLVSLATRLGRAVSHRELIAAVWGSECVNELDYLRVAISRLRRKIFDDPRSPRRLITVSGMGYRLQRDNGDAVPAYGGPREHAVLVA